MKSKLHFVDHPHTSVDGRDKFRNPQWWVKHAMSSRYNIRESGLEDALRSDVSIFYTLGTCEGPYWWGGFDSSILDSRLLDRVRQKTAFIHYDQSLEAFNLLDYYEGFHKGFEEYNLPAEQFVFSTSNLVEKELYDNWCLKNNITQKMKIICLPFFAQASRNFHFYGDSSPNEISFDEHRLHTDRCLFNSLNRVLRDHRVALVTMMEYYGLIEGNKVSHNVFPHHFQRTINTPTFNKHPAFKDITPITEKLPLILDTNQFQINKAQHFFKEIYLESWVSVITETAYAEPNTSFFSEKIFKPIRARHPFILVGTPGILKDLKKLGFKTFSEWWDESYDDITDPEERLDAICKLLKHLSTYSNNQWIDFYEQMRQTLNFNFEKLTKTDWTQGIDV